ncbi:MAG: TATA-box-binding protein [Thermoproteales archaeon]|nr:TATA-box-binding protein [Thermoproteales archaeon]RLE65687.1 MAG: TATA-box-binding protein [Thermoprotei archaeon]
MVINRKPKYRIENVVASVTFNRHIDLNLIAEKVPYTEYDPDQFPGLVLRINKPKTALLIFSTGKMVCTGAKSENEVYKAVDKVVKLLAKYGIDLGEPEITIQNIVASGSLNGTVDLERAALLLENTMYEPEQFPGLIYRMGDPRVVILVFSSGKCVCTGAKKEKDVEVAINKLYNKLMELEVLK